MREIIEDLERCQAENCMYPSVAESLFGRLNFVLKTTVGAVGRAATQPLMQRAHESSGMPCNFTPAMDQMLNFFRALLPSVPPLELPCGPRRHDDDPPVVVYTDASYSANGYSGLGIIIMDGDDRYEAGCAVPPWLLNWLTPRGQQINHLEALAAVAARLTFLGRNPRCADGGDRRRGRAPQGQEAAAQAAGSRAMRDSRLVALVS